RGSPQREIILVRLLEPSPTPTGLALEEHELVRASNNLQRIRDELIGRGVAARAVAFRSPNVGEDVVRLASEQDVDLVVVDGRRPLLGEGVPRGTVGTVLGKAQCDVAVLVERAGSSPQIGPDRPVVVPFGGGEHDWAALELGAWIASARGAPLRLLGAKGKMGEERGDASRLL